MPRITFIETPLDPRYVVLRYSESPVGALVPSIKEAWIALGKMSHADKNRLSEKLSSSGYIINDTGAKIYGPDEGIFQQAA